MNQWDINATTINWIDGRFVYSQKKCNLNCRMLTDDEDSIQPPISSNHNYWPTTSSNLDDDIIDLVNTFESTRLYENDLDNVNKPISFNEQSFPLEYRFLLDLPAINSATLRAHPVNTDILV
jgi:hypothetical protein